MVEKPLYKSVPTMRNYEDHISECDYTKGWNDAMDFIFPEAKKKREKERIKKSHDKAEKISDKEVDTVDKEDKEKICP